jgi:hypothetical protein
LTWLRSRLWLQLLAKLRTQPTRRGSFSLGRGLRSERLREAAEGYEFNAFAGVALGLVKGGLECCAVVGFEIAAYARINKRWDTKWMSRSSHA